MKFETSCIRFKVDDLKQIRLTAHRANAEVTIWIREAALARVEAVLAGDRLEPLTYETAGGLGSQLCVRFQPDDYAKLRRVCAKEGALPSTWIRAVAVNAVRPATPKHATVKRKRKAAGQ